MKRLIVSMMLLPAVAMATVQPPQPEPASTAVASSSSGAASFAGAAASSQSSASQTAAGGSATAHGGTGGTSEATASNAGNAQSLSLNYPRQAPSTAQGSLMIGACGAGGNAGGSNSGGSAFLGIAFTPRDCKLLLAASAYQALGMYDSACEMVNGISAVKARWKELGVDAPSCEQKPVPPVVTVPQPVAPPVNVNVTLPPEMATREYVQEVFKRSVAK